MPFASGGAYNSIPNESQVGVSPGKASFVDGFPPATRTPRAAGGVPPDGLDMNGILHDISAGLMYSQAYGALPWDSNFATATGYPKDAIVNYNGLLYQSLNEDNKAVPINAIAWGAVKGVTPSPDANDNQYATMAALQTAIAGIYNSNIPPAATISNRGATIGAYYSNTLSLSFTPIKTGYVIAFAKLNLGQNITTNSAIALALQINGQSVSSDETIASQYHFGVAKINKNTACTITLGVSSGSPSPAVPATYGLSYIFIPTN